MKKLAIFMALMLIHVSTWGGVILDVIPPQAASATIALSSSTVGGRNCLLNVAVDEGFSNATCQFKVQDGAGTTIWSVFVSSTAPSSVETWNPPTPGLPSFALCGSRGTAMLISSTCASYDISINGYIDK